MTRRLWGRGTTRRGLWSRLAALATAAALAGCAASEPPPPVVTEPEAPSPARVALLVPLGAGEARVARDARAIADGARLALEGGDGEAVALATYDTLGSPEGARAAAARAIDEGAEMILGPLFSSSTEAVAPLARRADVPVLSFSTDTTVAGAPVWVTGSAPEGEVARILAFAGRQGFDAIGVYAPQSPYGRAALSGLDQAAARAGVAVVARESYPLSVSDIERTAPGFVAEARRAGARAVLIPDGGPGLTTAARTLGANGMRQPETPFLGTGQWQTGATLREPTLRGGFFAGAEIGVGEDAFVGRVAGRNGKRPPIVGVEGHDAAQEAAHHAP
ncbi:MAG: penicillin-binding protein activator, partial [Paracoccaceae bacterium]